MRAAIIGAGSLGTIIGALMTKGNRPVDLIDTNREHVDALNREGARIIGEMDLRIPVHALTPDEMTGEYDLVFLLNKQTANSQVLSHLSNHLRTDGTVCTLQNGIPEPSVAAVMGRERTIGGAVGFGATWIGPGVSQLTTSAEVVKRFAFEIGSMDGVTRRGLLDAQVYLSCVGHTELLDDLMSIRWSKVLMNATFSGMSAALGCTFGEVLDDPRALLCIAFIANETVQAAHAEGCRMAPMQGEDFEDFALASSNVREKLPMIRRIWSHHRALRASMLQDLEKGRDTEISFINGIVCDTGRKHGLPTPFNDRVVELVSEAQSRRSVPDFSNIARFEELLSDHIDPK
ncbi:2-dehydropantoate 2-reductase [Halomonas sp. HP20-15]|uniref:ketopantoate reductase family protein n=1 Tax=Halomonas sp. HP20-15 TaxID=3085901 RepID=UPI002980B8D9|nr:2-dehydropantoate 2-reductase [Halomonas sp. HP20-15]MDW5376573.1 2-dehydropantoate 2-reductase [Halomonas sp. HP20-15]